MHLDGGRLVLSPGDLVGSLCCAHLTQLDLDVAEGRRSTPGIEDPELALLRRRGLRHEAAHLARRRAEHRSVVDLSAEPDGPESSRRLEEVLRAGPEVVYQAVLRDDSAAGPVWSGRCDFLLKVPRPSRLGPFSYEPADTKLARRVHPSAVLQLCAYAELLEGIQGVAPEHVHVILGDSRAERLELAGLSAYYRAGRRRLAAAIEDRAPTYPVPVEHCTLCAWRADCELRRETDDSLVLVAGLRADQGRALRSAGTATLHALAERADPPGGIGRSSFEALRAQARLQATARAAPGEPPPYELLVGAAPGAGLGSLPEPSPGDLFFDIEGDPYLDGGGLEYLLGVGWIDAEGTFAYRAFWSHGSAGERVAFERFIDFVTERRRRHPDLHIYHYAAYERTALGRLMGRHATRELEVDDLLRSRVLVDLYQILRQSVRVGTASYSLKRIEALFRPARSGDIVDAATSIVEYERWLEEDDPRILDALERYNCEDCRSTAELRHWLEARRREAGLGADVRPQDVAETVPAPVLEEAEEVERRVVALEADLAAGPEGHDRARRLLGRLLDWWRREEKPEWWSYFHRVLDCDEDDLYRDTEAVAGLEYLGPGGTRKKSLLHRYRFDPAQELKLAAGDTVVDPALARRRIEVGHGPAGTVRLVELDPGAGTLTIARAATSSVEHPRCLIPGTPVATKVQRQAALRVADAVIAVGIDGEGPYRAVRDLLLRRAPRRPGAPAGTPLVAVGEDPAAAVVRLGTALDDGVLAVQGPPGSGKTTAAARLAVELLAAGRRVGITANSHAVISHLLGAVLAQAESRGVAVTASQRADEQQGVAHPAVRLGDNASVRADLDAGSQLIAGTSWLFARPEWDSVLDALVVDEAGQLSLANVVAAGTAARSLVLVGDPQQLSQPSRGAHPPGADRSALGHLLDGHATIDAGLGVFLHRTHRLHPRICRLVSEVAYDGRLEPTEPTGRQALAGPLGPAGLRWLAVEHQGNRVRSAEESRALAWCTEQLVGQDYVDRRGERRRLGLQDIVVVAPYNAQVHQLRLDLPEGVAIGTVDRFQGREAPVVLISLATSDPERLPRGMEFLYSTNRLNVAVSRAEALVVLAASPALLSVRCRTVDQLRLANGLCRYVELAERLDPPADLEPAPLGASVQVTSPLA